MPADRAEILAQLTTLERLVAARLAEIREQIAALPLLETHEGEFVCRDCVGGLRFSSPERLAEHIHNVHS